MAGNDASPLLARFDAASFVGRASELAQLEAVLDRTAGADGGLVELSGAAGSGKTSLLARLAGSALDRGFTVLYGGSQDGLAAPYLPVVEAVRGLAAQRPALRLHAATAPLGALLPDLVAADVTPVPAPRLGPDPELGRRPLFDAVVALCREITAEGPLLFVFDDVHWASATTLDLVRHLVASSTGDRLLVATAHRGNEAEPSSALGGHLAEVRRWDAAGRVVRVNVDGLTVAELSELAGSMGVDAAGAAAVHAATGGNALLASLLLQRDAGPEPVADRAAAALDDIVAARLGRLDPGAMALVEMAAVAGPQTPTAAVHAALGDHDGFFDELDAAIAAGLLVEDDFGGLRFTHDLVRHVVLDAQMGLRVRARRLALAAALEREPIAPELVAVAFHHLAESGDPAVAERAAALGVRAAGVALDHLAPGEAADLARQALALLGDRAATSPSRSALLVVLADALHQSYQRDQLLRVVFDALAAAEESGEVELAARACLHFRELLVIGEEGEVAMGHCLRALADLGDRRPALRADLLATVATVRALGVDPAGAAGIAAEALALARSSGDEAATGRALVASFVAAWGTPDNAAQRDRAAEAYELGLRNRDIASAAYALRNLGVAQLFLGDRSAFERTWADLRSLAERVESRAVGAMEALWGGMVAMLEGRWDDAGAIGGRALELLPGDENIGTGVMSQALWAGMEQGAAGGMVPIVQGIAAANPSMLVYRGIEAYLLADEGDLAGAGAALATVVEGDLAAVELDWLRPTIYAFAAEAAWRRRDSDLAARLLPRLEPFGGQLVVAATATLVAGAFDRHIAALRHLTGETGAPERLDAALALERSIASPPLQARTLLAIAEVTGDRGAARDAAAIADRLGMARVLARTEAISST